MYKKYFRVDINGIPDDTEIIRMSGVGVNGYITISVGNESGNNVNTNGVTDINVLALMIKEELRYWLIQNVIIGIDDGYKYIIDYDRDLYVIDNVIHLRGLFDDATEEERATTSITSEFYIEEEGFEPISNEFNFLNSSCDQVTNTIEFSEQDIKRQVKPEYIVFANPVSTHSYEATRDEIGKIVEFEYISKGGLSYVFTKYIPGILDQNKFKLSATKQETNNIEIKVTGSINELYTQYKFTVLRAGVGLVEYDYSFDTYKSVEASIDDVVTVYIKDQFGCVISLSTNVVANERVPFIEISKSNSLRFLNRAHPELEENQLLSEWASSYNLDYKQIFTKDDIVKTQYKTNYNRLLRTVANTNQPYQIDHRLVQKNIGVSDIRTAKIRKVKTITTGINEYELYFISGNILNSTGDTIDTYDIGKFLPEYVVKGNNILINQGGNETSIAIDDIYYSPHLGVFIIKFCSTIDVENDDVIVSTVYDREKFNVYEFSINMNDIFQLSSCVLTMILNDSLFATAKLITEEFEITENLKNLIKIKYYNVSDTDTINKLHGVQNFRIIRKEPANDVSTEQNVTDGAIQKYNVEVLEAVSYKLAPIPFQIFRRLTLILVHENVTINGINSKFKSIKSEVLNKSNMMIINFEMYKSN